MSEKTPHPSSVMLEIVRLQAQMSEMLRQVNSRMGALEKAVLAALDPKHPLQDMLKTGFKEDAQEAAKLESALSEQVQATVIALEGYMNG